MNTVTYKNVTFVQADHSPYSYHVSLLIPAGEMDEGLAYIPTDDDFARTGDVVLARCARILEALERDNAAQKNNKTEHRRYRIDKSLVDPETYEVSLLIPGGEVYAGLARVDVQGDLARVMRTAIDMYESQPPDTYVRKVGIRESLRQVCEEYERKKADNKGGNK